MGILPGPVHAAPGARAGGARVPSGDGVGDGVGGGIADGVGVGVAVAVETVGMGDGDRVGASALYAPQARRTAPSERTPRTCATCRETSNLPNRVVGVYHQKGESTVEPRAIAASATLR